MAATLRPVPCLRCGGELPRYAGTGRRREYCGDACRRAGGRLRGHLGADWWHEQAWYPGWAAERARWRGERERERAEASRRAEAEFARERALLDAMPPDVRAGAEQARRAWFERQTHGLQLATARLEADSLNLKYADTLAAFGLAVQLCPAASGRVAKLLWAAASTDSEQEAASMLGKARALAAKGAGETPEAQLSTGELLRRVLGDDGA